MVHLTYDWHFSNWFSLPLSLSEYTNIQKRIAVHMIKIKRQDTHVLDELFLLLHEDIFPL